LIRPILTEILTVKVILPTNYLPRQESVKGLRHIFVRLAQESDQQFHVVLRIELLMFHFTPAFVCVCYYSYMTLSL
jgi:hypothetical protein